MFGSLMGDFDDDFMGRHMNAMNQQMRSINRMMNSLMPDPFNMMSAFDNNFQNNALMEHQRGGQMAPMGGLFGFPAMPNMNRLLSADIGNPNGASFCSSSVISMSSGPDGRPQIYQATQSTKTGPGGVRETRKTVQDSAAGIKKMAIGHHIGDRAHIIEKEQDLRSGQLEEHQEFINLDEEEAQNFDREFTSKVRMAGGMPGHQGNRSMLSIKPVEDDEEDDDEVLLNQQQLSPPQPHHRHIPALPPIPSSANGQQNGIHSSPYIALNTAAAHRRAHRPKQHPQKHLQKQHPGAGATKHSATSEKKQGKSGKAKQEGTGDHH